MSRIEPRRGFFASVAANAGRVTYGRELRFARVYARHPRLLFAFARFNRAAERTRHVPKDLSELATLRAATMVGCEFCIDIGSELARRSGLSDAQLRALPEAHESGLFSANELLALDLATAMSATPARVEDELMERVVARFGVKGAIELSCLIAWENTRARLNQSLDIAPEGFSAGKVCAIPAAGNGAAVSEWAV